MRTIDIRIASYFSGSTTFFGVVLAFAGLAILFKFIIMGVILISVSLVILTTHYRLMIDLNSKVYNDYVWILGLKNGDRGTFDRIEYLFIKKSKVSQTMNSLINSATIHNEVYDAYLKFSETHKIHLMTKGSKKNLISSLKKIATVLQLRIVDYSTNESTEIT